MINTRSTMRVNVGATKRHNQSANVTSAVKMFTRRHHHQHQHQHQHYRPRLALNLSAMFKSMSTPSCLTRVHRFQTYQLVFMLLPLIVLSHLIRLSLSPSFLPTLSTHFIHLLHSPTYADPPFAKALNNTPRLSLVSDRNDLNNKNNNMNRFNNNSLHAVLVCDRRDPCCHRTLPIALNSLLRVQSLSPSHVTVLHACARTDFPLFRRSLVPYARHVRNILACHGPADLERCLLHAVLSAATSQPRHAPSFILVAAHAHVFEPIAVESLWLSLKVRPSVSALTPVPFLHASIASARQNSDPLLIRLRLPEFNNVKEDGTPLALTPILLRTSALASALPPSRRYSRTTSTLWAVFLPVLEHARVLRVPLFTDTMEEEEENKKQDEPDADSKENDDDSNLSVQRQEEELRAKANSHARKYRTLSVNTHRLFQVYGIMSGRQLPAKLRSQAAFYKVSAQTDEAEMYSEPFLQSSSKPVDLSFIPARPTSTFLSLPDSESSEESDAPGPSSSSLLSTTVAGFESVLLIVPWVQMGGSESAILRLASRFRASSMRITVILTTAHWSVDTLGEVRSRHAWLPHVLELTSDVFDLVALAPLHSASRLLRHVIVTRRPAYILLSNSRWAYAHLPLIRTVAHPATVVADLNHMIHREWNNGGLPMYAVNATQYVDVHIAASDHVADFMRNALGTDFVEREPQKVKTCHIGSEYVSGSGENTRAVDEQGNSEEEEMTNVRDEDARRKQREKLGVLDNFGDGNDAEHATFIAMFIGRFVVDKGTDVLADLVQRVSELRESGDMDFASHVHFVFVGDGEERSRLQTLAQKVSITDDKSQKEKPLLTILPPPSPSVLRELYAAADLLILPSVNEGVALVVYDAMASGTIVAVTDVGAQREVITHEETGFLVPDSVNVRDVTDGFLEVLRNVSSVTQIDRMRTMRAKAFVLVRDRFNAATFADCVENSLRLAAQRRNWSVSNADVLASAQSNVTIDMTTKNYRASNAIGTHQNTSAASITQVGRELRSRLAVERADGLLQRRRVSRPVHMALTIGIKTYSCDRSTVAHVAELVQSIRARHARVRVILGNDGPLRLTGYHFVRDDTHTEELALPLRSGISFGRNAMVNITYTKYFALFDDDHLFDTATNLGNVLASFSNPANTHELDIVGLRVRNLQGIEELEQQGINIPRYVANISEFNHRRRSVKLCVWNENNGPGVFGLKTPIPVDVLHNAFIAKTSSLRASPWRDELHVNEHMTFFLDAQDRGLNIAYLPSEFVHHRPRKYSKCYLRVRYREQKYAALLDYDDKFQWDKKCGDDFPDFVAKHMLQAGAKA